MALLDWIELSDDDEGTVKEKLPPEKVKEELPLKIVQEEQNAHVLFHAAWLKVEIIDLTTEDDVEEDRNAHGNGDSAQWGTTSHMQQFVAPHGQGDAAQTVFPKQEYLASDDDVEEFLIAGDVAQEAMQSGNQDFAAAVGHAEEATHSENAAEAGPSSFTEQGVEASDCSEENMQPGNQDFSAAVDCAEEATHSENAAEAGPSSSTEQGVAASNCDEEVMQPGNPDFATAVDCAEEAMQSENVAEAGPSSFTEQVIVAGGRGEGAMQPGNPAFAAPVDCAEEAMQSENTAEAGPSLFTEQVVAGDHGEEAMQPGNPDFAAAVDCAEEAMQSENAAEAGPSPFTEQVVVAGNCSEEAMRSGNQVFGAAADCAEETMQSENAAEAGPSSFTEQGVATSNCGEEAMQPGNQDFAAAVDCAVEATHSENAVEAAPSSFTEQGVVASDRGEETMQPGNPDFAAVVVCAEGATQFGNAIEAGTSSSTEQVVVAGDCSEEAMPSGNQVLEAAVNCAEEAMQSENAAEAGPLLFTGQGVVASDCGEETMQSGKKDFVAAVDCAEEAMQSEYVVEAAPSSFTEGLAAGDFAKEAIQYKHADKAAECSPMTGQAAASSLLMTEQGTTASLLRTAQQSHKRDALLGSSPISTAAPFPRQFWKAGEFKVAAQASINSGQNCLRINPKFLHSNATSHKWVFGAIAELLDNAVDEVQNGATYVKIDKMKYSPVGEYSLMIQDDGGGMSPEYLRHCLSFGFSNKCTNSSIGQYGNGFKTSTMRLGADAIIFSCRKDNRLTRSVGLLSYTFLMKTGCDDILVPVVDYEFDPSSCNFKRIMDRGENHFSSNLSALLRWSSFSREDDLLNQFEDMGCHGTKIIVFNLWLNDASEMELDFTTDDEDIMISGAPKIPEERRKFKRLYHMHIANRFRYSLRVYASILYLHLPEHFKVILCGQVVEPHHIIQDLMYRECIKYRPHVGISVQVDAITSIGFLKGAPNLDIHGFNIYHRNRLILPFWAACSERGRGRGIAGVLEANFIRPTHDKQDFEKTELFQRLETRLKDMTIEYWKYHAHLIGYQQVTKNIPSAYYASIAATNDNSSVAQAMTAARAKASGVLDSRSNGGNSLNPLHVGASRDQMDYGACSLRRNMRTSSYRPSTPQQTEPCKRRNSGLTIESRAQKRQNTNGDADHLGNVNIVEILEERSRVLICQKNMLKAECSELEAAGKNLQNEADMLLNELRQWQRKLRSHAQELEFYDGLSAIQRGRINNTSMGVGWI